MVDFIEGGNMKTLVIALTMLGCSGGNGYQECVDAVYRGRPHSYYKERGIADAVSLAVTECMRSDLSPREYARTKVWKGGDVK